MNVQRKKSAVKKYSELITAGTTMPEVKALLEADNKGYTADEQEEILAALATGDGNDSGDDSDSGDPGANEDEGGNQPQEKGPLELQKYAVYKAEPIYKWGINEDTGEKERKFMGVEKKGDPIRHTTIEGKHAEELNNQVENSKLWYEPVKA